MQITVTAKPTQLPFDGPGVITIQNLDDSTPVFFSSARGRIHDERTVEPVTATGPNGGFRINPGATWERITIQTHHDMPYVVTAKSPATIAFGYVGHQ